MSFFATIILEESRLARELGIIIQKSPLFNVMERPLVEAALEETS